MLAQWEYYTGNSIYSQPGYQKGFPGMPSEDQSWRLAPDVSFPAGPSIAVYFNGGLIGGWGGTSFAAPMFAGVIADIDSVLYPGVEQQMDMQECLACSSMAYPTAPEHTMT